MIRETKIEKNMKEQFQSFDFFQVCTTIMILLNLVKWNQIAFKDVKFWGKKFNMLFNSLFGVTSRILMSQNFPTTFMS